VGPVLGREVIKGEQPFFVLLQARDRFWELGLVTGDELIIGFQSVSDQSKPASNNRN